MLLFLRAFALNEERHRTERGGGNSSTRLLMCQYHWRFGALRNFMRRAVNMQSGRRRR